METWQLGLAAAALAALVGAARHLTAAGSQRDRLARLERKLDLIMQHLGVDAQLRLDVPGRVTELAHGGQKVEAIRLLRQSNPWLSLREAKDYVEGKRPAL